MYSPAVKELIEHLQVLPGVGPRSAQRMALHLLERERNGGKQLANALEDAMDQVKHCEACRIWCEEPRCPICLNTRRDETTICIVESPSDVFAIENAGSYNGQYYVLIGHLSPIDGIGPSELGLDQLVDRLKAGGVNELIIATGSTVEGEATAHYITKQAASHVGNISRIAHGVPVGSELEYLNGRTLAQALTGRVSLTAPPPSHD